MEMEAATSTLYVHLVPDNQQEIKESFKVEVNSSGTISELINQIQQYLERRNDGNKIYKIRSIKSAIDGRALPLGRYISSYFTLSQKSQPSLFCTHDTNDVFCILECSVDTEKHVRPISVYQPKEEAKENSSGNFKQSDVDKIIKSYNGKMKTLTTYSYYEASNQKWVKVIINIENIKSHPKDKISVYFGDQTLDVFVKDFGPNHNEILHFGCRKLHKHIIAEECKWDVKTDGVYISLKKRSPKDNWWSFFKSKTSMGGDESDEQ